MFPQTFSILSFLTWITAAVTSQPTIESWSPNSGSVAGMTTITIIGSGFSTNKFQLGNDPNLGNFVYLWNDIVEYECKVQRDHSEDNLLMCDTPANMGYHGWLHMKVKADGVFSATRWNAFVPSNSKTPWIKSIQPTLMEPQTLVKQTGTQYSRILTTMGMNSLHGPGCRSCTVIRTWHNGQECDLWNRTASPIAPYEFYLKNKLDDEGNEVPNTQGYESADGGFSCKLTGTFVGPQNLTYIVDDGYGRSKTYQHLKKICLVT